MITCHVKYIIDPYQMTAFDRYSRQLVGLVNRPHRLNVRYWPILLKKSASISTAEKYAPEIEICVLGRRFRTRISHSSVQKRCFHPSIFDRFGQTDFFNRIGRLLPVVNDSKRPKQPLIERPRLADTCGHPHATTESYLPGTQIENY